MNNLTLWTGLLIISISSHSQTLTNKIVIDQFGYRPTAKKIAVIRNPQTGFDSNESFTPGNTYAVVKTSDLSQIYTDIPVIWNNGNEDVSSGDKTWWFDFSSVTSLGEYYILDNDNNVRSFSFTISNDIYNEVLKQAMRVWFYQRSGHAKHLPFAESNWVDDASHIRTLQDLNCRDYLAPNDPSTERDVHGGWYDAGDLNKYTAWTANYIVELLRAYRENPDVWTDDYNIPESGNGTPDIIDEIKWGMDHLLRMQNLDGSMIAIVSEGNGTPPSAATDQSLYGGENTTATLSSCGAFALGALVFEELGESNYATTLQTSAESAWNWADSNPRVLWFNNDENYGTKGIGAGQQEDNDDYDRDGYKLRAANFLLERTNKAVYKSYFENNYQAIHLITWNFAYPFEDEEQDILLEYLNNPYSSSSITSIISSKYNIAMGKEHNFLSIDNSTDPYRAHMDAYVWGSNRQKSANGMMYWNIDYFDLDPSNSDKALEAAEDYLHYIHGVNPMNKVYLTNMYNYGAENCADQIYHNWFADGSDWDDAKNSLYGPIPGIVPGGPNPSYSVDACCPSNCGSSENNAKCSAVDISVLLNQPKQKSYLDFNNSWPLNSWSVTENSMGYQAEYIRLLSKFVAKPNATISSSSVNNVNFKAYPNPASSIVYLTGVKGIVKVYDVTGKFIVSIKDQNTLSIKNFSRGIYTIENQGNTIKIVKK